MTATRFKDGSTELEPGLPQVGSLDDGLEYTFTHAGELSFMTGPFNAEVKFNFERQIDRS